MAQFSFCLQCTRAALFALNIVFILIGLSIMSLGIYIKVNGNFSAIPEISGISKVLSSETMQSIGLGIIITGILILCLSVFGCLGAVLNNRCLLYVYSIVLMLIILFEFIGVIVILIFRNNLRQTYNSGFMEIFHRAYRQNQTETIQIIENLEDELQCCGVNGPSDYHINGYSIPKTCYQQQSTIYYLYSKGCDEAIVNWIWNILPILGGVLGSILFIEIYGVISSIVVGVAISHSLETDDHRHYYRKI